MLPGGSRLFLIPHFCSCRQSYRGTANPTDTILISPGVSPLRSRTATFAQASAISWLENIGPPTMP